MTTPIAIELPGLDCGTCGYPTCEEFAERLAGAPELLKRCIHLGAAEPACAASTICEAHACGAHASEPGTLVFGQRDFRDSLGREFDFVLQHFPEEPGPREIILPHNPILTRELEVEVGDVMIGRPLGMSCGCPITHCGEVMEVDRRTGVMTWCVTGPLRPRQEGFKDIGYYSAEGYEGLVVETRRELRIGERYFFQPDMCMLQWRHSGLLNYLNHTAGAMQVRLEGLWIG